MAQQKPPKSDPWMEAAYEFGRAGDTFCAIKFKSPEWVAWADYFRRLNWAPVSFRECGDERQWTAPCRWPKDFRPKFAPAPLAIVKAPDLIDRQPGWRANLFVPQGRPGYAAMYEKAQTADQEDWCVFHNHPKWGSGIKVPLDWYQDWKAGRAPKIASVKETLERLMNGVVE